MRGHIFAPIVCEPRAGKGSSTATTPSQAGVTELPVKTLKKLKLEHPDFWKSSHDLPGSSTQREP